MQKPISITAREKRTESIEHIKVNVNQYLTHDKSTSLPLVFTETAGKMTMCSKDFYRNGESGKCQSCAELCHQAKVRGTVDLCSRLCPVSLHDHVAETQKEMSATVANAVGTTPLSLNNDGYLMPEVLVIALGVVIILVSLAALVILFYQRSWRSADHSSKRPVKHSDTHRYTVSSVSARFSY